MPTKYELALQALADYKAENDAISADLNSQLQVKQATIDQQTLQIASLQQQLDEATSGTNSFLAFLRTGLQALINAIDARIGVG